MRNFSLRKDILTIFFMENKYTVRVSNIFVPCIACSCPPGELCTINQGAGQLECACAEGFRREGVTCVPFVPGQYMLYYHMTSLLFRG